MMTVSKAEFDKCYRDITEGKNFVEYAEYYVSSNGRFWNAFCGIQRLGVSSNSKAIDIGGGIMAVLLNRLLGINTCVGDVNRRAADDVEQFGIPFWEIDLLSDQAVPVKDFDLVVLQEVIEHLPVPPYVVFKRIRSFMKPDGLLFITTPNGSRIRNILYLIAGKEVLDNFQYPGPGEALGHQQEYTLPQMKWQVERAGLAPIFAEQYDDGWKGATLKAQVGHHLMKPVGIIPHLRTGLMLAVRNR